ncbi:hypothetical protein [Staphylococcus agnetis]|uniref:hypothetical protein n=1 Tax=Staphylococcus agnetis TaxID=985762 RepID=UPI0015C4D962|nr:hypothetical protein [Staphylococcus agnetis]
MEFKKIKLNEVLTLNPTLKLKKNTIAKKIAMENINEYQKKLMAILILGLKVVRNL